MMELFYVCLQMKVQILQSYVTDLSEQNRILVHTVEELEKEAHEKVADLKTKLRTSKEGINVRRVNTAPGSDTCTLKE